MRLFIAAIVLTFAGVAWGHDAPSGFAYEPYCCNGDGHTGDCQMIPSKTVRIVTEGFQVTLLPGDHRLATHKHIFFVPQKETMESPDGAYHLCLFPNENTVRCFYAPPVGF